MNTNDFFYNLPEELIAQTPIEPRDHSRLLSYNRETGKTEHRHFYDVTYYLKKGDVLVINNTRVLPARIYGIKQSTGAKVEFLLHKRINLTEWEVLSKPAKKAKCGENFKFSDDLGLTVLSDLEDGAKIVRFNYEGVFESHLARVGEMPLPHYIHEKLNDKERYQTVYSKTEGSAAAPTAGLHFTNELLDKIRGMGIEIVEVMLHVGLGTFRPVKVAAIEEHKMHSEYYEVTESAANSVNNAVKEGRRVIAVGTTSVRVLESAADDSGLIHADCGFTQIFLYPPYKFKVVKGLITNFHLPESTLIMLVSAFCGRENTLGLYNTAVENKYRFFSFGDSMIIL